MGCGEDCGVYCIVIGIAVVVLSPVILQGIGTYYETWIVESCASLDNKPACCTRGFITYNRTSCSYLLEDLNQGLHVLQYFVFIILLAPIVCFLAPACCDCIYYCGSDGFENLIKIIGGFVTLFYPAAGVLNFIGCMVFVGEYSGRTLGSGFYCCLSAGLFVIIESTIIIYYLYREQKRKTQSTGQTVQRTGRNTIAPVSSTETTRVGVATIERAVVVKDPNTGGFFAFVMKVNVFSKVTSHN